MEAATAAVRAGGERSRPLDGVSLAVNSGEFVCLLGPNGAGKSTLLRVMAGTLAPVRGEVLLFGKDLATLDRQEIARSIAVVPQQSDVAWAFAVRDVVTMGRAPHQRGWMVATTEDRRVVSEVIEQCDLTALAERQVAELSGGEQRRVAIARALAQRPKVLLLDEPGAFLDIKHQVALCDLLAEIVQEREVACIAAMHDLNVAAQYATRVALAKKGRLVGVGSVTEVMTEAKLGEVFETELYAGLIDATKTKFFIPVRSNGRRAR
jgi:iron complex transport system ATP-binding protein